MGKETKTRATFFALTALVFLLSAPFAVCGHRGRWARPNDATAALLADGFLAGHTYLAHPPRPELLKQENPLAPEHVELWFYDLSLYRGRLYTYWGPTPALVMTPLRLLFGSILIPDAALVVAFLAGRFLFGALLLWAVFERHFAHLPRWMFAAVILAFGLSLPTLTLIARPAMYELAIAGSQFFLSVALWAMFCGSTAEGPRARVAAFALAGLSLAFAAGSRVNFTLLAGVLVLAAFALEFHFKRRAGSDLARPLALRESVALGLPAALGVLGLAAYNHARFGSPWETGARYQMGLWVPRFGPESIPPNLWAYLTRRPIFSGEFPFVLAAGGAERPLPDFIPRPEVWSGEEPFAGFPFVVPFFLFTLAALPLGVRWWRRGGRDRPVVRLAIFAGLVATVGFLPCLLLNFATFRYMQDPNLGLSVLAALGFWGGDGSIADARRRRVWRGAGLVAALLSAACGVLVPIGAPTDPVHRAVASWLGL